VITPGLWRRALARGAQWRLLLLYLAALALPALLAALPVVGFLGELLDHSPQAPGLVRALDSAATIELMRQFDELNAARAMAPGLFAAALVALGLAPLLAAATVAVARAEEPLDFRALLHGTGEYCGRLLRMAAVAALPLGVAAGIAALAFRLAKKASEAAVLETAAQRNSRLALAVSVLSVLLAHVTLEAGRAHFGAQPERRSAFLAWWSGVRLLVRHPLRVLGLCAVTSALGLGLAAALMAAHLHVPQRGGGTVLLAVALAQLALAAVAWGRSSRMAGLTELVLADKGEQVRLRAARFEMAPPRTSPPAPAAAAEGPPAAQGGTAG
jgi:hypothetical protein